MTMQQEAHQVVDALNVSGLTQLLRMVQSFDDAKWNARPIITVSVQNNETEISSQSMATVSVQEDEAKKQKLARMRAAQMRIMARRKKSISTDEELEQGRYEAMKEKYGDILS